ncbi:LCD1 [Candida theae]|uniref:LCD1 n=1 Tax=Candida theae TaxID=1198502 RepID=A0AAD5BF17_9ASCO|nr:LCD1 [Candida theae]KAI5958018.1 LCD1 [Candida theae]
MTHWTSESDSDFANDDEDDELLQQYLGTTQAPIHLSTTREDDNDTTSEKPTSVFQINQPIASQLLQEPIDNEIQAKLFQADGEIATLKAQLISLQNSKRDELNSLRQSYDALKRSKEEEATALREAVLKLEDDRKFLKNELVTTTALKKRKISNNNNNNNNNGTQTNLQPKGPNTSTDVDYSVVEESAGTNVTSIPSQTVQRVIRVQHDTSALIDQIWGYFIPGSKRSSIEYLFKICFDFDLETLYRYKLTKKTAIASLISNVLMTLKIARLDELIEKFSLLMLDIIQNAIGQKQPLPVPFLLSLIHCTISFRPVAVTKTVITTLIQGCSQISLNYMFLLSPSLEEEVDFDNYHDVPDQVIAIERFILICCLDVIEKLTAIGSMHDTRLIRSIWCDQTVFPQSLVSSCLPQNTERFKSVAQINLVFNVVEMLIATITEGTFGFNEATSDFNLIQSLMKIFLLDIPIKDGFRFYGLNRFIGNNCDLNTIDLTVPLQHDNLNNYLVSIPQPVYKDLESELNFKKLQINHEAHLLNLKIKVCELLQSIIITKQSIDFLMDKDHFKSFVRVIRLEQTYMANDPRSTMIHSRVHLIGQIVKIMDYLTQDLHEPSDLIYTDTMYEMFVAISRIAFGADSLAMDAQKLLVKIRSQGHYNITVFNRACELRARQLHHLTVGDYSKKGGGKQLASAESDFANGLEFPYESETVELSRDILNRFVNHEEADNLYYNMNYESQQEEEEEEKEEEDMLHDKMQEELDANMDAGMDVDRAVEI